MIGMSPSRGWTMGDESGPVVFVTRVGAAGGARAAAAALAYAASESDRAALLIDLSGNRAPRPSLIATAAARRLEERVVAHMPEAAVASRGRFCQLTLPADLDAIERVGAALPVARESAGIVYLPPPLLRAALEETRVRPTGALLRADLPRDRALTALAARDLMVRGLRVAVLKRQLGWLTARAALLGALPAGNGHLPARLRERLLCAADSKFHNCYDGKDEQRGERQEPPPHAPQGSAPSGWWKDERCAPDGPGGA